MRILVDTGAYRQNNAGDNAMLQVALRRLHALWPSATVQVLTFQPEVVRELCPGTQPLLAHDRNWWLHGHWLPYRVEKSLSVASASRLRALLRRRASTLALGLARRGVADVRTSREPAAFLEALETADLFVVAGGGVITDSFASHAQSILETIRYAARQHITTAMLGHAIGPANTESLRRCIRATLPQLDLLTLREERAGLPLLRELGAMPRNVRTTGDDAIEIAYSGWVERGSAIGVNVRVASYANVGSEALPTLRATLLELAKLYGAPLAPIPVSLNGADSDHESLRMLLGADYELPSASSVAAPSDIVSRVASCRLVVSGSYHAAVFALARGIPVVGLARSRYYSEKFLGLREQFGIGVSLVQLDGGDIAGELRRAVGEAWNISDSHRRQLIEAAERQVEEGNAAYRLLRELFESGRIACRIA